MTENEAIFKLKRPPYEVWQYGIADLERCKKMTIEEWNKRV